MLTPINYEKTDEIAKVIATVKEMMGCFGHEQWFIAGGFWRDILAGRQWRDVDVFIPGVVPLDPIDADDLRDDYDLGAQATHFLHGVEVNIVQMNKAHTLETLLDRIDLGLCQIGTVRDRDTLWVTEDYLKDAVNKTLTVCRDTRANHVIKVAKKFPEYTVHTQGFELSGDTNELSDIRLGDDDPAILQAEGQFF